MRQASRRSWRPGQRAGVEVTFLAYRGTLQERALGLVAAKVKAALIVEGELPDDGLAGLDADDHDQVVALAKRLVDPDAADDASLEAMFAESRALEAEAEETLNEAHRLGAEPIHPPAQPGAAVRPPDLVPDVAPTVVANATPDRRSAQLTLDFTARPATSTPMVAHDAPGSVVPPPVGRVVRFEDLALLARPRARRRKGTPVGQLDLFAS